MSVRTVSIEKDVVDVLGPAGLGHAQPVTVELLCMSPLIEIDKLPSGRLTSVDHLELIPNIREYKTAKTHLSIPAEKLGEGTFPIPPCASRTGLEERVRNDVINIFKQGTITTSFH